MCVCWKEKVIIHRQGHQRDCVLVPCFYLQVNFFTHHPLHLHCPSPTPRNKEKIKKNAWCQHELIKMWLSFIASIPSGRHAGVEPQTRIFNMLMSGIGKQNPSVFRLPSLSFPLLSHEAQNIRGPLSYYNEVLTLFSPSFPLLTFVSGNGNHDWALIRDRKKHLSLQAEHSFWVSQSLLYVLKHSFLGHCKWVWALFLVAEDRRATQENKMQ